MPHPNFTWPQHGDELDATHYAYAYGAVAGNTGFIVNGLDFTSIDYTSPAVDIGSGRATIRRTEMTTAKSDIPTQTFDDVVMVVGHNGTTGVSLTDSAVNHVFIDANTFQDDSPKIVTNTTGTEPSDAALKIGEVDTNTDTASPQWNLISGSGTLTYPDVDSLDTAATDFRAGTVLYDRQNNEHYEVS